MEYYSTFESRQKKEVLPALGAWGNLEDIMIMISEISQTERKTACSHFMWIPERFSLKKQKNITKLFARDTGGGRGRR